MKVCGFDTRLRRFVRSGEGGAALELAVVMPILLLLIIGVIDYGRVFYTSVAVANAARAGAEYGARDRGVYANDAAAIQAFAQQDGLEAGTLTLTSVRICECGTGVPAGSCTALCGGGAVPDVYVRVTASKIVNTLLPYPGIPNSFSVSHQVRIRAQ